MFAPGFFISSLQLCHPLQPRDLTGHRVQYPNKVRRTALVKLVAVALRMINQCGSYHCCRDQNADSQKLGLCFHTLSFLLSELVINQIQLFRLIEDERQSAALSVPSCSTVSHSTLHQYSVKDIRMGPIKPRQVGWSMTDNMTSRHLSHVYCHRNRSGKEKNSHILRPTGGLEHYRSLGAPLVGWSITDRGALCSRICTNQPVERRA